MFYIHKNFLFLRSEFKSLIDYQNDGIVDCWSNDDLYLVGEVESYDIYFSLWLRG